MTEQAKCRGCGDGIRAATVLAKIDRTGDCWLWLGQKNRAGYGKQCHMLAHRLVWSFLGNALPEGLHLLHRCDNPPCVNPAHLFLGTQTDNMKDMYAKGRQRHGVTRGEDNGFSKLTKSIVREIRILRAQSLTQHSIAARLGVTRAAVCDVLRGRSWKHVL